jgi:hypothetical protein
MALYQSEWALGRLQVARPQTAFATHSQLFLVDVPAAGFQIGDILEIAALPPYANIVDAAIVPIGSLGAATVDIGLMSGEWGELTNTDGSARTCGNELFAASTIAGLTRLTKTDMLILAETEKTRSIGVKFAVAAVTAGAGKQIGLMLHFKQ